MASYKRLIEVTEKFKMNAPKNGVIIAESNSFQTMTQDEQQLKVMVYFIRWFDEEYQDYRTAAFSQSDGEYLGETGI